MATVLGGATIIDGTGADPKRDLSVVLEGPNIQSVEGGSTRGDKLDLGGLTLLPGLIDAHTHFGVVDLNNDGKTSASVLAARVFRNCSLALDAGFTTVRDTGGVDGGIVQAISWGLVRGPRILPSGPIICQSGGHGDLSPAFASHHHGEDIPGLVKLSIVADGPDEVRHAARMAFKRGATQIKVCVSGGVVSLNDRIEDTQFSVEELRAAVEEAEARDTYVAAHSHNVRGIMNGLEAGVHSFEHATFLDEPTASAMAKAGAVMVPTFTVTTLLAQEWKAWGLPEEVVPRLSGIGDAMTHAVKIARDAGVTIGSGSDLLGPEQSRFGLELTIKAGILGPMEAIVSATSTNAKIIRLQDQIGTIEPGKLADLIAIDGDPLADPELFDDPSKVVLVIKNGEIVKDLR